MMSASVDAGVFLAGRFRCAHITASSAAAMDANSSINWSRKVADASGSSSIFGRRATAASGLASGVILDNVLS
jgi:hypothetical protein